MIAVIEYNSRKHKIDLSKPIDISIPVSTKNHVNAWRIDGPKITPFAAGNWVGNVQQGGDVNFNHIEFNPHSHCTHTETVGHISETVYCIHKELQQYFFLAEVVTIPPESHNEDFVITKKQLKFALGNKKRDAIIIRTLPNLPDKKTTNYSNTNPTFLLEEAAEYLKEKGIKHLLFDMPSVDKEKDGGLLLRFSGPNMAEAQGEHFLLPVPLRAGGRALSGSLSWADPQGIAPFSDGSPFYGLDVPEEITVRQQVLADPTQDLEDRVWARLGDGTPFITAKAEEKGLIILVHTSANAQWSDFALSGLYVSVLERIIRLSGLANPMTKISYDSLDPILVMDGYGGMVAAPASVQAIPAAHLENIVPSPVHPPGLYGRGSMQYALNIGTNLPRLKTPSTLPLGVARSFYQKDYEINLMPAILYGALILFCLDWVAMLLVAGTRIRLWGRHAAIVLIASLGVVALSSPVAASEAQDLRFASGFYLAYIKSGDPNIDDLSQRGLEVLAGTLTRRTSVEPDGVVGLDPATDPLAFFPLIYWPVGETSKAYSGKAIQNIQHYLDHGGTILFDTRDQNRSTGRVVNTPNAKALRAVTASLNAPPLIPIPDDHVLGRAFYLLEGYPGMYRDGTLWVEQHSVTGRDNVSSVLIGSNDWIGAWASSSGNQTFSQFRNTDSRQQEMALRFGVNLVMYTLTGNYKADQVHIPHILKRLGR